MSETIMWIIIGLLAAVILAYVVYKAIVIFKMDPEERKKTLITYLKGLVALAEQEIGSGHGAEKLALVEEWFKEKAPFVYKAALLLFGKDNLKELIEQALKEIKESFEKGKITKK